MELDDEGKSGRPDPPEREGGKRAAPSVKDDLFGDIEFDLIDEEVDAEDTINDVYARDTAIPAAPEHLSAEREPAERGPPDTLRPLAGGKPGASEPQRGRHAAPLRPPPQHTLEPPSEDLEFDSFDPPVDVFGQPIPGVDPAPFQPRAYGQSEMPTAPPAAPRGLLEQARRSMPAPDARAQRPAFLGETARHPPAEPGSHHGAQRGHAGETARRSPEASGGHRAQRPPLAEPARLPPAEAGLDRRAQRPAFLAETARHSAAETEQLARATMPGSSNANRRAAPPPASEPPLKDSALDFVDGFEPLLDSLAPMSGLSPPSPPSSAPRAGPREMQECYAVGDFSRALSIAEEILARSPDDAVARKCAQNCRDVLTQMFAARIGPLDQVISVAVSPEEVQWLALDHRAGFLLSLVDGQSTVDEILDISGMTRLDALKIIFDLIERHVVRLA